MYLLITKVTIQLMILCTVYSQYTSSFVILVCHSLKDKISYSFEPFLVLIGKGSLTKFKNFLKVLIKNCYRKLYLMTYKYREIDTLNYIVTNDGNVKQSLFVIINKRTWYIFSLLIIFKKTI